MIVLLLKFCLMFGKRMLDDFFKVQFLLTITF